MLTLEISRIIHEMAFPLGGQIQELMSITNKKYYANLTTKELTVLTEVHNLDVPKD